MSMENKGPGGVGVPYGQRTTFQPPRIDEAGELKPNSVEGIAAASLSKDEVSQIQSLVSRYGIPGVTVGLLGDSITQENFEQSASAVFARAYWANQAASLLGHRIKIVNNAGVSSDNLAGMLARVQANGPGLGVGFGGIGGPGVPVTTSPSPLLNDPQMVFVMGGVNDILAGQTAAYITGLLEQIYSEIRTAGKTLVAFTITPMTAAQSGYSVAKVAVQRAVNDWIRAYCRDGNAILVDAFQAMVDPTNAAVVCATAATRDGTLHPNNRGGYLIAREVYRALNNRLPPVTVLPTSNAEEYTLDATIPQILPNPLLTGTASITATGYSGTTAGSTLGNANFVRSGSATVVLSAVAHPEGFGQRTKMAASFTAAGETAELRFPSQHARAVVGGRYVAMCEIVVTGPSGAALAATDNLRGVQLYIQYNDGTTNSFAYAENVSGTDAAYPESFTKVLMTTELTIPATGTPTTFRPNLQLTANGSGGCEVSVGRIGLIRVA